MHVLQPCVQRGLVAAGSALAGQPASACACERAWSPTTNGFIHNPRRNRLTPARADKLVFMHSNLRLKARIEAVDFKDGAVPWRGESYDEVIDE